MKFEKKANMICYFELGPKTIQRVKLILLLLFFIFSSIWLNAQTALFPISANGKVGYINIRGDIVIEPRFDTKCSFFEVEGNGIKTAYNEVTKKIDTIRESKILKGISFPSNAYFSEGKATVRIGDWFLFIPLRYSYASIDSFGNTTISNDDIEPGAFKNGISVVRLLKKHFQYTYDNLYGYINTDRVLLPIEFRWAGQFSENKAIVLENDLYGYIDTSFKLKIFYNYKDAGDFTEGLAPVMKNNKFGYIDENEKLIIEYKFDKAWSFREGTARVLNDNKYYFIDKSGNKIFENEFEGATDFNNGIARVQKNGKLGFIGKDGDFLIQPQYTNASNFENGTAAVEKDGFWVFINQLNEIIIDQKFEYASNFKNGLAEVWLEGEMYYINKDGKIVSRVFWDDRKYFWEF